MADTQLSALLEVMPNIAAAVNDFQSESVQRDAFRVLVDAAGFDVSCVDWDETAMSTALLEGFLGPAGLQEVMDKLAATEPDSLSSSSADTDRQDARTVDELRAMARQAGRGEAVSLA